MFWISAVLIVLFVGDGRVPAAVHRQGPLLRRSQQGPAAAQLRGLVRLRRAGLRRLRPHHLRRPVLDPGRDAGDHCSPWSSARSMGIIAGFFGGGVDAVLSRIGDIFFAIPLLLGGILVLYTFPSDLETPYHRRGAEGRDRVGDRRLAQPGPADAFQRAPGETERLRAGRARPGGQSDPASSLSHILPNSLAPVIVVSTINLGAFISVEATLSFLGIGLQPPAISWGLSISQASGIGLIRIAPHMLLFPSLFLVLTVLSFIMLGDAIRDALDPKMR